MLCAVAQSEGLHFFAEAAFFQIALTLFGIGPVTQLNRGATQGGLTGEAGECEPGVIHRQQTAISLARD